QSPYLWQCLENPLRLLQQGSVLGRGCKEQNRKRRRDARCVEGKLAHLGPPNIDHAVDRPSGKLGRRCLRQFYEARERTGPRGLIIDGHHSRPRPPSAPPTSSIHKGLSRLPSVIAAAAIVTTTAGQLVSAARAMTVPLAITNPITTGTRPRRTICCHGASRNRSHSR